MTSRPSLVTTRAAAGYVAAAVLVTAAGIELARAWTTSPGAAAEAGHVIGGVVIAVLVVAAFGLATRAEVLTNVSVAAVFVLFAHGGTLVLEGQTVGALFAGLAPIVAALAVVTTAPPAPDPHDPLTSARMMALWLKTARRKTAPGAARVASPTRLGTPASRVTITVGWVRPPSPSSSGSAMPRTCASNA